MTEHAVSHREPETQPTRKAIRAGSKQWRTNVKKLTLAEIDTRLKRWQSRMTRAHNAIVKLNRQRKRITNPKLMADYDAYMAKKAKPVVTETTALPELDVYFQDAARQVDQIAAKDVPAWTDANCVKPKDDLSIPKVLLREKTKQGTPEQRKAMPLSDRKAMEFIKAQSAKVTAKRAKRELRINK